MTPDQQSAVDDYMRARKVIAETIYMWRTGTRDERNEMAENIIVNLDAAGFRITPKEVRP